MEWGIYLGLAPIAGFVMLLGGLFFTGYIDARNYGLKELFAKTEEKNPQNQRKMNRIVGCLFFGLGIWVLLAPLL